MTKVRKGRSAIFDLVGGEVSSRGSLIVESIPEERLGEFIGLAFRLYEGDPNWVPPLVANQMGMLKGKDNAFLSESEHTFLMCFRDGLAVGRIMVAVNEPISRKQGVPTATFSLLEAEDGESFSLLVSEAMRWAKGKGMKRIIGPWSPTNGEDGIGMMVMGFDDPPVLLNSYNKRWYVQSLEAMGFSKLADYVGYKITKPDLPLESLARASEITFQRAGVIPSKIDMSRLDDELAGMHSVMSSVFSEDWYNEMPSLEEFMKLAAPISKLAYPELVWLAKDAVKGKTVAFVVALPDWNQVLIRMRGRVFPFGWFHYLRAKSVITRARLMMQYCLKEYQGSSVIPALYAKVVESAEALGLKEAEASVILETNLQSRRALERLGGKLTRTYRWYLRDID